jgi:hypothetical protein
MACRIAGKREPHLTFSECSGVRSITICWLKLVESKDCGSKEMDWRVLDESLQGFYSKLSSQNEWRGRKQEQFYALRYRDGDTDIEREREREREREEGMAAKEEKRGGATEEEKRKTEVVQAEVARMKQLPPNSAYATHRLRVLDKMQQLLSKVPILLRAICL